MPQLGRELSLLRRFGQIDGNSPAIRADFDPNGFSSSSPTTPATQSVSHGPAAYEERSLAADQVIGITQRDEALRVFGRREELREATHVNSIPSDLPVFRLARTFPKAQRKSLDFLDCRIED